MKRVALTTGAGSGSGRELARIHAEQGRELVIVARSAGKLNPWVKSSQGQRSFFRQLLDQLSSVINSIVVLWV